MKLFPDFSTILQIGGLSIRWYSLLMLLSFFVMYYFGAKSVRKQGHDNDFLDNIFIMCVVSGIIGARLWYVIFFPENQIYWQNPILILEVWNGGLAIQGAVVGATLAMAIYTKKHHISLLRLLDSVFPAILIAQALGRWGNFFNQEAFGPVVSPDFFKYLPKFIQDGMFIDGAYRMPMFLIESSLNIIGFILIYTLFRKYLLKKRGDYTYAYLFATGVIRYYIEGFRTDSLMVMGFKSAQIFSLIYIVIALLGYFGVFDLIFKKPKPVIIFDLDGTVVNTRKTVEMAYLELYKRYRPDEEISKEDLDEVFGPPLPEGLAKHFPGRDIDALIEEYRQINTNLQKQMLGPIKHIPELISQLKKEGYQLGIFSNKNHQSILYSLEICQIKDYFDVIVGIDDVLKAKPDKEGIIKACHSLNRGFDDVIFVGDSRDDVRCANNVGAFSVAYLESESRREQLLAEKPNVLINDHLELLEILKEKHSWTYNLI